MEEIPPNYEPDIVIGSSQGGAVVMALSHRFPNAKFILFSPAWKLFQVEDFKLPSDTIIVHGQKDMKIPIEDSVELAQKTGASLRATMDGHNLHELFYIWALRRMIDKMPQKLEKGRVKFGEKPAPGEFPPTPSAPMAPIPAPKAEGNLHEVSPPGWSGTVAAMIQKHPELSKGKDKNPWALAWWMKKRGAKPHYKEQPKKDSQSKKKPVKKKKYKNESFKEWYKEKEVIK
jgi:hypothetical protein